MISLAKSDAATVLPLESVRQVLETLIAAGQLHDGLWPSCLSRGSLLPPAKAAPAILGQREWDRSWPGCNLMHDIPTLHLLYALEDAGLSSGYREAADAYLRTFLERCVHEETGLFYWGEHAYWDLQKQQIGNSAIFKEERAGDPDPPLIHDHLRQAPPWFWERVNTLAPARLQRFVEGLERHWTMEDRSEYCRHAIFSNTVRYPRWQRSCDFPRHSGHYVVDLASAYRALPRPETAAALSRFGDYWWQRQDGRCLPMESRTGGPPGIRSTSQTLSLGISMLDAAAVLKPVLPDLAAAFHERGATYCQFFLEAPHDLKNRRFVANYPQHGSGEPGYFRLLGSVYGSTSAMQNALLSCAAYRTLNEPAFLSWAISVAQAEDAEMAVHQKDVHLPALDVGLWLELLSDLADLTGDRRWLERGRAIWPWVHRTFFKDGLVLLASGHDWYEAQQGSSYLLHGAARLGLMINREATLAPDYSAR